MLISFFKFSSCTYLQTAKHERQPGEQAAADGAEEARADPGHGPGLRRDGGGDVGLAVRAGHRHGVSPHLGRDGDHHHLARSYTSVSVLWGRTSILLLYRRPVLSVLLLTRIV